MFDDIKSRRAVVLCVGHLVRTHRASGAPSGLVGYGYDGDVLRGLASLQNVTIP